MFPPMSFQMKQTKRTAAVVFLNYDCVSSKVAKAMGCERGGSRGARARGSTLAYACSRSPGNATAESVGRRFSIWLQSVTGFPWGATCPDGDVRMGYCPRGYPMRLEGMRFEQPGKKKWKQFKTKRLSRMCDG